MSYKALIQKRADLVKEQQALFAKVDTEKRELTDAEKLRDDEIHAELTTVAEGLKREERRREWERTVAPTVRGVVSDMHDNEAERGFGSFGEQLRAITNMAINPGNTDRRILAINEKHQQMQAATGMHEGNIAEGGGFVQTDFSNDLIERMYETGKVLSQVPEQPIGDNANAYSALLIRETSRATGSRYGGLRVYRTGEGATITPSRPEFDRKEIKPYKVAALCYLTDELVTDATALQGHVTRLFPMEASFVMESELFSGTGAGQSMGVLNATATVSQAKESGQAAATIVTKNISKMWARCWAGARSKAVWYADQSIEPELDALYIPVGTGGLKPENVITYDQNGQMRIKGRPVVWVEYASALGTVGDIVLADFSQYLGVSKGQMRTDSSIHVAFVTGEMALRFTWRYAAEPLWRSALTPANGGSNTLSPFVTLATRS